MFGLSTQTFIRALLICAIVEVVTVASALAQQPRYDGPYGPVRNPRDAWQPQMPRYSPGAPGLKAYYSEIKLSGEVVSIDTIQNSIRIRDRKEDRVVALLLDSKCKIKADKKEFGTKRLKLEQLETGYQVNALIRRGDFRITEMQVKKPKESAPVATPGAPK